MLGDEVRMQASLQNAFDHAHHTAWVADKLLEPELLEQHASLRQLSMQVMRLLPSMAFNTCRAHHGACLAQGCTTTFSSLSCSQP